MREKIKKVARTTLSANALLKQTIKNNLTEAVGQLQFDPHIPLPVPVPQPHPFVSAYLMIFVAFEPSDSNHFYIYIYMEVS